MLDMWYVWYLCDEFANPEITWKVVPLTRFQVWELMTSGDPGVELRNDVIVMDGCWMVINVLKKQVYRNPPNLIPVRFLFKYKELGWWNLNPFCQIEFSEDDIFILFTSVLGAYGFEIALRGILLDGKTGSWMWIAAPFVSWESGGFAL